MANKILVARGTKARLEEIKSTLATNELVYSTDTGELGVKKADGEIEYFMNAADIDAIIDTKLVGKANATHTHTKSQITDFPTSMPPTAHSTDLLTSGTLGIARGGTGRTDGYTVGVVETRANTNTKIWTGTESQYNAIGTKDANTLYFIEEE